MNIIGNNLQISRKGAIKLILPNGRCRNIGKLEVKNGITIYFKRVSPRYIFKKTNAWGINWQILSRLPNDAVIMLKCTNGIMYSIYAYHARLYGEFLHFKNKGFELQYFIPLKYWKIYNWK